MPHSPKVFGHMTAPVQFERWCILYLEGALERGGVYNMDSRRLWARRTTRHIMSRFNINSWPKLED